MVHDDALAREHAPLMDVTRQPIPWRPLLLRLQLALALLLVGAGVLADVTPLPRSQWPRTLTEAVPLIVATLTPAQKSIVRGTSRENLFMLQGEWGEDIEQLLGLRSGNTALVTAVCGATCSVDEATLRLLQATWDAVAAR